MGDVTATATATVDAPPERVLAFLRDYQQRSKILTSNYTAFRVEPGPVLAFHAEAGGRGRDYRLRVVDGGADSDEGVLREADELSSFVNEWHVSAAGAGSSVTLTGTWKGADGIGGLMEGLFAPLGLRRIYAQVLANLASAL
jgi:hypothetical protein